jgi:hypothetical protein
MIERRQHAVDVLTVAAEIVVWFMVLRVVATISEGTFWADVARNLENAARTGNVANPQAALALVPAVQAAADGAAGPSLLVMLMAGFGAFVFARALSRSNLDGALGALVLLFGSILALNVLLRIGLGGDWRLWDMSGVASFMEQRETYFAHGVDLDRLSEEGMASTKHGGTLMLAFGGLVVVWVRFLIAARGKITFERVLRTSSVGFLIVLIALAVGGLADVPAVARYALVFFVLAVSALAFANNARAVLVAEGARHTTPWLVALGGTVAVLTLVALVIGLLAYVNAGVVLTWTGSFLLRIIEFLLLLIITPIYWLFSTIFNLFFPDGLPGLQQAREFVDGTPDEAGESDPLLSIPGWVSNLVRYVAVLVTAAGIFLLARLIVTRRRGREAGVEQVRSRGSGGAGLGELLRDIFAGSRGRGGGEWMARHPIYRLYGRVVNDSHARGFRALPGETPLEFSARASHAMSAPFEPVGAAFDRARYGRHYPAEDQVREMQTAVAHWEREMPPTPELRERLAGAPEMDAATQAELRVQRHRYMLRGDIERARRIEIEDTRG